MDPEQTRQERFIQYAPALKERFDAGVLAELQDQPQWVVWRAELEDSRPKKGPYNPHYSQLQAKASVNIPKSWGTLTEALTALERGHYSGQGTKVNLMLILCLCSSSYTGQVITLN
jgi:hypothetical protein